MIIQIKNVFYFVYLLDYVNVYKIYITLYYMNVHQHINTSPGM